MKPVFIRKIENAVYFALDYGNYAEEHDRLETPPDPHFKLRDGRNPKEEARLKRLGQLSDEHDRQGNTFEQRMMEALAEPWDGRF